MNAMARVPNADENPLDLDQSSEHTTPATQDVEREGRDDEQSVQLRRAHAAQRRRRTTLQNVMAQWKDAARPEYRPFAEALRAAMGKRGMTASDVAREIWGSTTDRRGYSVAKNRDRIGLYLAATSYPDDENMRELARVLEIPVEELAGKLAQTDTSGNTHLNNPGPRPSRSSGPSLTPVPGRTGMVRIQVDQVVDWRLAMRVFSELSQAAEVEAEIEGKDVANAVAKVQARARADAAEIKEQAEKAEGHGGRGSDNEVA